MDKIMRITIKLAGHFFTIEYMYPATRTFLRKYAASITTEVEKYDEKVIRISFEDIIAERKKSEAEDIKEGIAVRYFPDDYLETLAIYRKIANEIIMQDVILFHGSVIAVDGKGYLFTAKSGTGKSTHTRLWREYFGERAVMVNDDKPLIYVGSKEALVYGTPWDGKHHLSNNISVPLCGICMLKRSSTGNHIRKITGKEAYPMLLQQTFRSDNPDNMIRTMDLLGELSNVVALYELHCNMEPEAAVVSYEGMNA